MAASTRRAGKQPTAAAAPASKRAPISKAGTGAQKPSSKATTSRVTKQPTASKASGSKATGQGQGLTAEQAKQLADLLKKQNAAQAADLQVAAQKQGKYSALDGRFTYAPYSVSRKRTAALLAQEAGEQGSGGEDDDDSGLEDDILPRRGKSKQRRISSPTPSCTDQDDNQQKDLSGVKALFVNNGFTEAEVRRVYNQEENADKSHEEDTSDEERNTAVGGNDIDDEAEADAGGTVFDEQEVIVLYFIISLLTQNFHLFFR